MAAEYFAIQSQIVEEDANIAFLDGERSCRKGYVTHRSGSGVFRLKGVNNCGKTIYRVTFGANVAIAPADDGGVLAPVSVALTEDGEPILTATVTPAAIGDFFSIERSTFIIIPCGCCVTIALQNTTDGSAIEVTDANIIIDRVA